jgi:hypothetical protein
MVMHLLIANSLMYLSLCHDYDPEISFVAHQHFKAGAQLLVKNLTDGSEPDHASIFAAFYFTYCYMTKRKDIDVPALCQLSRAVLRHIERYNLDVYCTGRSILQHATYSSSEALVLPKNNRSFLARMLMWIYYQDVIGCSMGHGGALASYMTAHRDRLKDIYRQSTTALESFWGDEYPVVEVVDDVENAVAIEFLHDVWTCLHHVSSYYADPEANISEEDEVQQQITALEQVSLPSL